MLSPEELKKKTYEWRLNSKEEQIANLRRSMHYCSPQSQKGILAKIAQIMVEIAGIKKRGW